jgi:hypothetical protein
MTSRHFTPPATCPAATARKPDPGFARSNWRIHAQCRTSRVGGDVCPCLAFARIGLGRMAVLLASAGAWINEDDGTLPASAHR